MATREDASLAVQEMQDKIYNELGQGASWRARRQVWQKADVKSNVVSRRNYNSRNNFDNHQAAIATPKVQLDELGAKFVVSALVCFPNLVEEYEEKLLSFTIKNDELRNLLDNIFDIVRDEEVSDFTQMLEALKKRGLDKKSASLLEFKMLRQQNSNDIKMRENIDLRIVESQLRQLDVEIKECLRIMQNAESLPDDVFKRYESLKKERENLIKAQNFD